MKRIGHKSFDGFVREREHGRAGDEGYSGFAKVGGANQAVEEGCHLQDVHSEGLHEGKEDVEIVRKGFCVVWVGSIGPAVYPI